jgi:hypothetical protein
VGSYYKVENLHIETLHTKKWEDKFVLQNFSIIYYVGIGGHSETQITYKSLTKQEIASMLQQYQLSWFFNVLSSLTGFRFP